MVEQKAMVSIHNRFDIVVRDAVTEEIIEEFKAENIVLDRMYTRLLNFQTYFSQIVFGSGSGTPTVGRTTLFNRIGSKASTTEEVIRAYPRSIWTQKIRLGTEEFNGSIITEVGISETSTNINTHAMISDAEGNPLSVEKNSLRIVDIYATVFVEMYDVDSGLFWYGDGLRNYLTGSGAAGNTLGISFANDVVTRAGTIVTNVSEKSVKSSARFNVDDLNREIRYMDWTAIGLRCEIPRPGVFEGIQKNAVKIGVGDGIKTTFKIPQSYITDLAMLVNGTLNTNWTFTSSGMVKFNTPPAVGDIITANYFCKLYPKDSGHIFDASMKIQFGIGQPTPVVPAPIMPTLPGSTTPIAGGMNYGFFGEVPAAELITGDELCNQIGLTVGVSQNSDAGWLKYKIEGRHLFVAKKNIKHTVSWDNINESGAVFGDSTIKIGNNIYLVRLLTSTEWDKLIQPVHKDGIAPRWGTYDNTDLNITGNGGYCWTSTPSGSRRVFRGINSVGGSDISTPSFASSLLGFRPVLEFLYTLPSGV